MGLMIAYCIENRVFCEAGKHFIKSPDNKKGLLYEYIYNFYSCYRIL